MGAIQLTVAAALPRAAVTLVGARGTVTVFVGVGSGELVGRTSVLVGFVVVAVPAWGPSVLPVTTAMVVAEQLVSTTAPAASSLLSVLGVLPLERGAVQLTVAEALPSVAVTLVGAFGTVAGVTGLEGAER